MVKIGESSGQEVTIRHPSKRSNYISLDNNNALMTYAQNILFTRPRRRPNSYVHSSSWLYVQAMSKTHCGPGLPDDAAVRLQ